MDERLASEFLEIARLIAKFQAIETALKCVLVQYQIDIDKKNNNLKDSYSLREVDELSYGILLRRYLKVSKNDELYSRLLKLKDYRNFLAHKSLLSISNMPEGMKKFIGVHLEQPFDYQALSKELDECILLFSKQHSPI